MAKSIAWWMLLLAPLGAVAADLGENLQLSGFGSLGLAHSSNEALGPVRRDMEQPFHASARPAAVDSRLGLQLNWTPDPHWQTVLQWVASSSVNQGLADRLEWAFVGWSPNAAWTLRAGRVGLDIYMLGDARQVGVAYPWVRPNQEYYGFMPIYSVDGLDLAYRQVWQGWHWRVKTVHGRASKRLPTRLGRDYDFGVNTLGSMTFVAEKDGWTLRASQFQFRFLNGFAVQDLQAGLTQLGTQLPGPIGQQALGYSAALDIQGHTLKYRALGLAFERGPWQLQGEISQVTSGAVPVPAGRRWYVSAAYRVGPWQPYLVRSVARPDTPAPQVPDWATPLKPLIGPARAAQAQGLANTANTAIHAARNDQASWTLGLRRELSDRMALKLQVDRTHVQVWGAGMWAKPVTAQAETTHVVSASLDFSF